MKEFADHTNRFDGKGEVYAKGRPRYADGLFTYMKDTLHITAGSVLAHDIPAGVVAAGAPCCVIRPITEADKIKPEQILF